MYSVTFAPDIERGIQIFWTLNHTAVSLWKIVCWMPRLMSMAKVTEYVQWKTGLNEPIKCPKFEKKFKRDFFGEGIPSFLENSYQECEEIVRSFPTSFRFALTLLLTICSQSAHNVQKFEVRSRSNFFSNFGYFIGPFDPIFHFHFKNIIFLKSDQNWHF